MEGGIRAQRSSHLSFMSKGGSQEVDLVPHFFHNLPLMELKIRGMIIQGNLNCQEKNDLFSKNITNNH